MPNATFSVIIVTAPPPGTPADGAAGAFVKMDGREIVLRTVELFVNRDNVKQIQVVVAAEQMEEAKRRLGGHFGFSGVKLITGGPRWMNQLAAAGKSIAPDATHVIVHDGARPAVPYSDIDALLAEAEKHDVVGLTAPVKSTLVEFDEGGGAVAFHLPSRFAQLVTPQAYAKAKFLSSAGAEKDVHASEMTLLKGSPLNQRLSHGGEVSFIKAMINMLPKPKIKAPSSPFEEAQW